MRIFDVVIKGTKPILLHNPAGMGSNSGGKKAGEKSIPTAEAEAAAGCYWMPDNSSLMFPGDNIHAAIISGSSGYKVKKQSLVPFVAGSVEVAPEHVPFGTTEYEIDTRRAVVQRQGIRRSRPKLRAWVLRFEILVDDDFPVREAGETLRNILEETGRRIGIGDFRPQKKGKFGKFIVERFEERN